MIVRQQVDVGNLRNEHVIKDVNKKRCHFVDKRRLIFRIERKSTKGLRV